MAEIDVKWFYDMTSSRQCRSFTKKDNEQINTFTHRVIIALWVNY